MPYSLVDSILKFTGGPSSSDTAIIAASRLAQPSTTHYKILPTTLDYNSPKIRVQTPKDCPFEKKPQSRGCVQVFKKRDRNGFESEDNNNNNSNEW